MMNLYFYKNFLLMLFTFSVMSLLLTLFFFYLTLMFNYPYMFIDGSLISISLNLNMFSFSLSIMVMFIGYLIMLYSMEYLMKKSIMLFLKMMVIFIFSMILILNSSNFTLFILGWDGLGLSSYFLIVYYNNYISANSSMLVIFMNRVSDVCLIVTISLLFSKGDWELSLLNLYMNETNYMIIIFIFLSCIIKSAQLPFSKWLPLAMAAPTPVSSLVHSSTLVIAGVYLYYQLNNIFPNMFINLTIFISSISSLIFSLIILFEMDLKKNIAYTTLIQLSYMFMMLSLNLKILAVFHIIMHALYKASLFMVSGNYIYFNKDKQNLMSGLYLLSCPVSSSLMIIFNLVSWGVPFMSSFFSKDMMLDFMFFSSTNIIMIVLFYFSFIFFVMGSMNLIYWMNLKSMAIHFYNNSINYLLVPGTLLFFTVSLLSSMVTWLFLEFEIYNNLKIFKYLVIFSMMLSFMLNLLIFMKFNKKDSIFLNFFLSMMGLKGLFSENLNLLYQDTSLNSRMINKFWLDFLSFKFIFFYLEKFTVVLYSLEKEIKYSMMIILFILIITLKMYI